MMECLADFGGHAKVTLTGQMLGVLYVMNLSPSQAVRGQIAFSK